MLKPCNVAQSIDCFGKPCLIAEFPAQSAALFKVRSRRIIIQLSEMYVPEVAKRAGDCRLVVELSPNIEGFFVDSLGGVRILFVEGHQPQTIECERGID